MRAVTKRKIAMWSVRGAKRVSQNKREQRIFFREPDMELECTAVHSELVIFHVFVFFRRTRFDNKRFGEAMRYNALLRFATFCDAAQRFAPSLAEERADSATRRL